MNFKRKLLNFFLIFLSIIIPLRVDAYTKYLIPGGDNIGINIKSNGVFVVGFYPVNGIDIAKKSGLRVGDRIVSINNLEVEDINDLIGKFDGSKAKQIKFGYIRNNKLNYAYIDLYQDANGGYKTGIYVKDTITGMGTLTYINPKDNTYGALGHEIVESASGINFTLLKGNIISSKITSITKSDIGKPGEKNGILNYKDILGSIEYNIDTGIYGKINQKKNEELIEVGNFNDVLIGKAEIITTIENNHKEKYNIEILSIDENNATKNFLIRITDKRLLDKTGGIIKGMSGSPIIQNGKIIGAITHALVDNPKKGYGIGITKMLESIE